MAELPQVKKWSGKKILQYQGKVNKFLLRIQEKLTFWRKVRENGNNWLIDHFTVVSLATWPLNGSEAAGDLVLIQTSLFLLCKSTCSYANQLVFTWEKQRGLYQSKVTSSLACIHGQITKHTTVQWPIEHGWFNTIEEWYFFIMKEEKLLKTYLC